MPVKPAADVLITGASGAIGSAIAFRLARSGYRLHLTSRNPKKLGRLKDQLKGIEVDVSVYKMGLSSSADAKRVANEFFKQAKVPYGLVCCAGDFGTLGAFADVSVESWIRDFSSNFLGHARLIHAFVNGLGQRKKQDGSIVVMSGAGLGGNGSFANFSCYSTAKAAITHLVEALGPELGKRGLRINAVSPGQVYSSLTETMIRAGVKRVGDLAISAQKCKESGGVPPGLAADLTDFLLSPASADINGRLISARFDSHRVFKNPSEVAGDVNLFRLRRIDGEQFVAHPRPGS